MKNGKWFTVIFAEKVSRKENRVLVFHSNLKSAVDYAQMRCFNADKYELTCAYETEPNFKIPTIISML